MGRDDHNGLPKLARKSVKMSAEKTDPDDNTTSDANPVEICLAVSTQYRCLTDGYPDIQTSLDGVVMFNFEFNP